MMHIFRVYVLDILSTSIHLRGNINCLLIYQEDHLKRVNERVIVVQRQFSNFSAISWREQVNVQWNNDEVHFILDQHAILFSASSLKKAVPGDTCHFTRTHYSDFEPTSFCSFSLML